MRQQAAFAFHCALRAIRTRWQRLDDSIEAAGFVHLSKRDRQRLMSRVHFMLSGPGRPQHWKETLSPEVVAAAEEADRELDATIARIRASGINLRRADGAVAMTDVLKKS